MKKNKKEPYKFNTIKKVDWLKQYKNTGSFTNACTAISITPPTVYASLKVDKEFNQKKEDVDNLIDDAVESRLYGLTKTSPVACFFWLCNRRKDRWQNIQKLEHSGQIINVTFDKQDAKL